MFFLAIFLGFIVGVLYFIRDYQTQLFPWGTSMWYECLNEGDYFHLVTQGALLGSVGSVWTAIAYVVVDLCIK